MPVIYEELWRVASNCMRGERPGHLLQTTALVNEAYLRLIGRRRVNVQTRIQFFAVAAQVMRRVLVDYARGRNRIKRGEGSQVVSLDGVALLSDDRMEELLSIHAATRFMRRLTISRRSILEKVRCSRCDTSAGCRSKGLPIR